MKTPINTFVAQREAFEKLGIDLVELLELRAKADEAQVSLGWPVEGQEKEWLEQVKAEVKEAQRMQA